MARDTHIVQHTDWALFSLKVEHQRYCTIHHMAFLAKMASSAHDDTRAAGDSYSGSSAEIVHTSSDSEAQNSNKTAWRISIIV